MKRKLENLTAGFLSLKESFCQEKKKGKTTALNVGAGNEPLQILGFCNLYQLVEFIQMVMILISLGGYMYQKSHDD